VVYADDRHAELGQLGGDAEGVLAADRDQGVDTGVGQVVLDLLHAVVELERVGARGPQDGAPARQDAAALLDAERHRQALERALPAVAVADELEAVGLHPLADDGPDHRVEAGTVTASREHSDPHGASFAVGRWIDPT
jgi:hypothetical protein